MAIKPSFILYVFKKLYYRNTNKGEGHYKSNCFSTHNGKLDKLPKKYLDLVHNLKNEYKNVFGIEYSGSNGI